MGANCSCKIDDITDMPLGTQMNGVQRLSLHTDHSGLSAVQRVCFLAAHLGNRFCKLVDVCMIFITAFFVGSYQKVMEGVHLAQSRPGITVVYFTNGVGPRLTPLPVIHKDRAKGNTEIDVQPVRQKLGGIQILSADRMLLPKAIAAAQDRLPVRSIRCWGQGPVRPAPGGLPGREALWAP